MFLSFQFLVAVDHFLLSLSLGIFLRWSRGTFPLDSMGRTPYNEHCSKDISRDEDMTAGGTLPREELLLG